LTQAPEAQPASGASCPNGRGHDANAVGAVRASFFTLSKRKGLPHLSGLGDLWVLGRHRLLCGDGTVATDVERVLVISILYKSRGAVCRSHYPSRAAAEIEPVSRMLFEQLGLAGADASAGLEVSEPGRWRKADSNHRSHLEKSGRSETRASASCIAQPTGAAANDIGADDRQAAGDQIIATRLRRRSCR
jgi:hypothetical protein